MGSKGAVTPVKDQGQCGEFFFFFRQLELLKEQIISKQEILKSLSEQQLVDCSNLNMGCNGGLPDRAFRYLERTQLCSETSYSYTASDGNCKKCTGVVPLLTSYSDVPKETRNNYCTLFLKLH